MMEINPFLMLSGVGMIAVSAFAILYWREKSKTKWIFYLLGGALWAISIALKIIMDLLIL